MARRPLVLPLLALAALPFRVPIEVAGTSIEPARAALPRDRRGDAGGGRAGAARRRRRRRGRLARWEPGWLERLLALTVALYGIQATYSDDFDKALQQVAFFVVPFALLFVLLARIEWTPRLLRAVPWAARRAGAACSRPFGYVEYARSGRIFLNPKLIASNDLHTYFRTNSVFLDPNIYGRFLVVAMLAVVATMMRRVAGRGSCGRGPGVLVALWAGLVLTLSQSSLGALAGGASRRSRCCTGARGRTLCPAAAVVAVAVGGGAGDAEHVRHRPRQPRRGPPAAGRVLVRGGGELFLERPGARLRERRVLARVPPPASDAVFGDAATASHTIPITVAAEQGVVGLLGVPGAAGRGARTAAAGRLGVGRAGPRWRPRSSRCWFHTLVYAAFLEDPLTWALLGVGAALAAAAAPRRAPAEAAAATPEPTAAEQSAARQAGLETA